MTNPPDPSAAGSADSSDASRSGSSAGSDPEDSSDRSTDLPSDRPAIRFVIHLTDERNLLEGLEAWLKLGLLSDFQVRQLGQEQLSCPVPTAAMMSVEPSVASPERSEVSVGAEDSDLHAPSLPAVRLFDRLLNRFMAEVSVIWLLFLGVFLVVLSSGVLAASQWQNVSAVGQYGILLTYTLVFFGVSNWALRRPNLQLTAQMLRIATLLIIPVNFWMIDGLRLWQTNLGLSVGVVSTLSLTLITLRLRQGLRSPKRAALTVNHLGLSWLHLGWALPSFPLIASYLGIIGTALLLVWTSRSIARPVRSEVTLPEQTPDQTPDQSLEQSLDPPQLPAAAAPRASATSATVGVTLGQGFSALSPTAIIIVLSALLLIGRALLLADVLIAQLGLALGVGGWLLNWLSRSQDGLDGARYRPPIWRWVGSALLLLGWAVAVGTTPPWQAFAVSGLAIWLLLDRLRHQGQPGTLILLLIVGLQAYTLLWRLLPDSWQTTIVMAAAERFGAVALPQALLGLAGLPYLWITLLIATRLRSTSAAPTWHPLPLRRQTELLALVFGVILTSLSLLNPGVRSLNLWGSSLTLLWVIRQHPESRFLTYFTHLVVLGSVFSTIAWLWFGLSTAQWAGVLLGVMLVEWGICLAGRRLWRHGWYMGLGLACCSYILLVLPLFEGGYRNLIWLVVPASLTALAWFRPAYTLTAAWVSTGALCAQILLLSTLNTWSIGLAVATGLMIANTYLVHHQRAADVTIGVALGWEGVLVWQQFADSPTWDRSNLAVLTGAFTLWGLWLLRHWLIQRLTTLRRLYAKAAESWAIVICTVVLLWLTLVSIIDIAAITWQTLLAISLTIGAIVYRLWQHPDNSGFYRLAWSMELGAIMLVAYTDQSVQVLAVLTFGFGFGSLLLAEGWVRKTGQPYATSWHGIPLVLAGLGLWFAHLDIAAFTGLYTLAAGLIVLGVGHRSLALKPWAFLGLLLVSAATYELLIYRLLQVENGRPGDHLALLAGLAMLLAWGNRQGHRLPYLRFMAKELQIVAHLHWGLGSGLAVIAVLYPLSTLHTIALMVTAVSLSSYALLNGRGNDITHNSRHEQWTYFGIVEGLITIGYGLSEAISDSSLLMAWAGAIAAVIAFMMEALPWSRWGWSSRPWRNAALGLPLVILILTANTTALQSLLIAAAFYAWFAKTTQRIRLSYLSIVLLDWAIIRFVIAQDWFNLLWFSSVVSGSLLYITQVDPDLQTQSSREQRHWLRAFAIGLVSLTALYQAEVETGGMAIGVGVATLGFSLALIAAGLFWQVRAFLYVGTLTFILRVLRWLWLFVGSYSLLLWAIGIVLGLLFIWIAATFESRRSQVNALMQYWSTELDRWE